MQPDSAYPADFALEEPLNEEGRRAVAEFAHQIHERIDAVRFEGRSVVLVTRDGHAVPIGIASRILEYAREQLASADQVTERVVRERTRTRYVGGDVEAELVASGQILDEGPGLSGMQGAFLECKARLDAAVRAHALCSGALEHEYPSLLELRTLARSGYTSNFPQHLLFVAGLHRGVEATQAAQGEAGRSDLTKLVAHVAPADLTVAPTICYHCFRVHQDRRLQQTDYMVTAVGKCGRREAFHGGLERLQVFTMREIVAFGTPESVEERRWAWLDDLWTLVDRLDLTARAVVAFDPFFGGNRKKVFQAMTASKIELQLWLPERSRWSAVASFNHHGGTLTRAFEITAPTEELNSGCFGVGFERFIYGALSQLGVTSAREFQSTVEQWGATPGEVRKSRLCPNGTPSS